MVTVLTHVDYTLYCETDEPARDSSRSGYKGDLLDLRSGGVYGGMGVGMFWGQRHAKFPRLTEAAIRISGTPPSQALSERTFSELLNAQTRQQSRQSGQHLEERLYVKDKAEEGILVSLSPGADFEDLD